MLSEGAHEYSLRVTPEEVGLDSRFTKPVEVEATIDKTNRELVLRTRVTTGGKFTCDRCLEEFEREVNAEYTLMYVTDDRGNGLNDEEVQLITPEMNHIDLGEDVRQFTILGLPQKMLCRDDCAGLCASCGTNLNNDKCQCPPALVDARWSGLEKLSKN